MTHIWEPDRYLAYAGERGRPFVDLLARVGASDPSVVVDLGCGPGNLTALLARRWPRAEVTGVDVSPEMIARARSTVDGVAFRLDDVRDWAASTPAESVDVLVSNAALQWVPGHLGLLPELARTVGPDGWLAFQVPGNFAELSHTLRGEVAAEERYAGYLTGIAEPASHDPAEYLAALTAEGFEVDAWETTYLHVLTGPDPVFTWVSGTSLLPTKAALPGELWSSFEAELKPLLADAYPADGAGRVVMPFRRVFVVATRKA